MSIRTWRVAKQVELPVSHPAHRILVQVSRAIGEPTSDMGKQHAIRGRRGFTAKHGQQADAVQSVAVIRFQIDTGQLGQGREQIHMSGEIFHASRFQCSVPVPERECPSGSVPCIALVSAHVRIPDVNSVSSSVVIHHDHEGVLIPTRLLEVVHQSSEVLVDIGHHAEKSRLLLLHLALEGREVFFRSPQWRMG